jgi:hypothetical protein
MGSKMQQIDDNTIVIELASKMVILQIGELGIDVNVEELLKIDYGNILGEILTFPVAFNRIGNLKAEIENQRSVAKLDLEVFEAQLTESYQKTLAAKADKKPTIKDVETAVLRDVNFITKKKAFFEIEKHAAYIDSLYWAARSKDDKLHKLTEKIRPDEFEKEILEGQVNGILIKCTKKAI